MDVSNVQSAQNGAAPAARRMGLGGVIKGRLTVPRRITIYGDPGIGKSTWAAGAPAPIFLGAEDGTSELDVTRFPEPQNFDDVLEAVSELTNEKHEFQTLVIDSLDWLEPLIWAKVCKDGKVKAIEDFGFGKGYTHALDTWRQLLAALDRMRHASGVSVLGIAHAHIKTLQNPEGDDYDRYLMKLNEKAAGLIYEWMDAVFFAQDETFIIEGDKGRRSKAVGSGKRVMHTVKQPFFMAKNRYALEPKMPLSYADFAEAMAARDPKLVRGRIDALLAERNDPELAAKVRGYVAKIGDDIQRLCEAENRLKGHSK